MFAKTWRVHAIFKNVKMKKKVLTNMGEYFHLENMGLGSLELILSQFHITSQIIQISGGKHGHGAIDFFLTKLPQGWCE